MSNYAARTAAAIFSTGGGSYLSLSASAAPSNSKLIDLELNPAGLISLRRINDAYSSIVSYVFQTDSANNFRLFGFTAFGDNVAIKIKELSGTTSSIQGGVTSLVHGLDSAKIRGCNVVINYLPGEGVGSPYTNGTGYEVNWYFNSQYVHIDTMPNNSADVLSKPFTVLIFYTN